MPKPRAKCRELIDHDLNLDTQHTCWCLPDVCMVCPICKGAQPQVLNCKTCEGHGYVPHFGDAKRVVFHR